MTDWKKYYYRFVGGASVNAAAFIAYRLYVHYRKNKLNFLKSDDFTPKDSLPYKVLDFNNHMDKLSLIEFEKIDDELGAMTACFFEYKTILFGLSRYDDYEPNTYTLWVDVEGCIENDKVPKDIADKFIEVIGFKDVPAKWVNKDWNKLYKEYLKNNPKETK